MNSVLADFQRRRPLLYDLIGDIHPDRWRAAGLSPAAAKRLADCPRSRRTLSGHLGWLGVAAANDGGDREWDLSPGSPESWAIRPGEELWRAGLRFGAARFRADISRLVWRKDIAALTSTVGEDAYRFALRRAALAWPDDGLGDAGREGSLGENILCSAILALNCWLAGIPRGLAERARLKLPMEVNSAKSLTAEWPAERRAACLAVLGRMFAPV